MKVAVFSTKAYDREFLTRANQQATHTLVFHETQLNAQTALLAQNSEAVCCFVNDRLDADTLAQLAAFGIQLIALRCAGFNQVDLAAAKQLGIKVARVAEYSPHAVAEHALGLVLMLNRNLHRAHHRVRENDYSLNGLLGFDLVNKTVGVIGTGKIGQVFASIMRGIGCRIMAYDPQPNPELLASGVPFVSLEQLWREADIISLHCPLNSHTYHMVNSDAIAQMKTGVMLINTGRGGLIDTRAVIEGLKSKKIGYLGLDVYEEEGDLFFEDYSNQLLQDDVFARLLTFPNVVITGHQAFFTREALDAIARITIANITHFEQGEFQQMVLVE
ncbi:2-hydroxyacid dehydrogenase [Cellvibrio japonicus]|uniref:D-lactate dehydrogenase n=1 Tax=Cellvibrio japonicus (strain Ueda107) TaxID=498211 RepID=B3PE96_CELJU|nr:2-hydroxyacid dehydrogenase [Cellvibrio japonicus]ACE86320.1 D-lactate dehydrogenase [Cellvibrio japonicus Ueda107]QEI12136.1 2-hydroxyacid dehydrogenase [Cellvibrio japonicus]QEI15710.1 2-hydroxyacid dehydrogenase [Cellvibrio japonicus]QEI19288.1 2-hydroxyacid dehydrogenase [Cellvibrio japonicus]